MKTMCIGLFYMALKLNWRDSVPRIFYAAWMLVRWSSQPNVHAFTHLKKRRMDHCRSCPFFEPKLQSCGHIPETTFDTDTTRVVPLGCWCYLPIAASIPEKDCWARAHNIDVGWPDHLRPFEIETL